jgi:DNA-3-methyladenine glycosylase
VAPTLLGRILVRMGPDGSSRAGRIVEVEAYGGRRDPASHAFRGPTPRTAVMFGPPGHLYVYRSYGMHWCANVVCDRDGEAGAVLIRALEPVEGVDAMWADRPAARRVSDLASGPGKLCAALGITGSDLGADLVVGAGTLRPGEIGLFTDRGAIPRAHRSGPRVGISRAVEEPWRFWVPGNPHVSRGRGSAR